jgi:hypothetical protein
MGEMRLRKRSGMKKEKECPACELMNAEEADTCKHCGTAFFFELECLERRLDDPADELRIVGRYANVVDANMMKGLLESNGIEACVPEELSPQILWYLVTSPLETVTVRVAARNLDAARRIIEEHTR